MFYNNMSVGLWLVGVFYPVLNSLAVVGKFLYDFAFGRSRDQSSGRPTLRHITSG